jgi:hypothetical protein
MRDDLEQRIRERAFRIWLDEGRPEGRDKIHWDMSGAKRTGHLIFL